MSLQRGVNMQYGIELYPYERINKVERGKNTNHNIKNKKILKGFIYFLATLLISRVILVNSTAPFGVATTISFLTMKEKKLTYIVGAGSLLGYLTLFNSVKEIGVYFIVIITLLLMKVVINKISILKSRILVFSVIFVEVLLYKILAIRLTYGVAMLMTSVEVICILPIYLIINYSRICFQEYKTKHLFSNEELVSMAIGISLMVSGTWGIAIYSISLRNILALSFVLSISYANGCGIGAAVGVSMGLVVGMSSKNMNAYISVFGLCGLIPGIFKETGKWFSAISYLVSLGILIFYSKIGSQFKLIEVLISCSVFLLIPNKFYNEMEVEFNKTKKEEKIKEGYIEKIKTILVERLNEFSDVLYNMASILYNLVDNDKLVLKNKSGLLIENLADRVCSTCNMNSMCWKRELHYTYSAFSELIGNFQVNKIIVPAELERKCVKRTALLKHTEQIVNNHIISEMWRSRLSEGRELIASQIENMAISVDEIMEEFNTDIRFNNEMENRITRMLEKNLIFIEDCVCIDDKNDRTVVRITMKACGGAQTCGKEMIASINEATSKLMCISDEGCRINANTDNCLVVFEEMPKFYVSTFVSRQCKEGEISNGDSYFFSKLKDGTYMSILSDGMGSGPGACQESKAVIDLIEKLTVSGFSKMTAINTANSIMTLKFSENEKFSTVDLSSIDLYTGDIEFMKVGAVASFILSEKEVISIKSKTLPIGVLDKVDVDVNKKKVKNGDMIIMISDGVLDYDTNRVGDTGWIIKYLEENQNCNPKAIADGILEKSKELGGKVKDDMTVIVSKVFSLY